MWGLREWLRLGLFYATYSANTVSLTAFDATNAARQADPVLALSDAATGALLGLGSTAYLAGKFTAGPVADALGGAPTSCLSLGLSAASLIFLSTSRRVWSLNCGWIVARYAQAAAWPGVMMMTRGAFAGNGLGTAVGLISTSSRVGAILGNVVLGALLGAGRSWRFVLRAAAAWSVFIGLLVRLDHRRQPAEGAEGPDPKRVAAAPRRTPFPKFLSVLARSPKIWLIYGSNVFATPVFQFASLLPMYLVQSLGLSQAAASQAAAVFPMASALSVLASTAIWGRLSEPARLVYCATTMTVAGVGMGVLGHVKTAGPLLPGALVMIMAGVSPTFYLASGEYLATVGGTRAGTLTAWLDLPGYGASQHAAAPCSTSGATILSLRLSAAAWRAHCLPLRLALVLSCTHALRCRIGDALLCCIPCHAVGGRLARRVSAAADVHRGKWFVCLCILCARVSVANTSCAPGASVATRGMLQLQLRGLHAQYRRERIRSQIGCFDLDAIRVL